MIPGGRIVTEPHSDQGPAQHGLKINVRILLRLSVLIPALLPLFILVLNVAEYHVDVPFWDQWNFIPLLGQSYEQGLTLADLSGQHNEHRLLFPRLIMLGLARASRYNIVWELVVIILLASATFALLWHQFFRTAGALGYSGFPWPVPVISLLVFTLGQAENWLWGWQIQIYLNVLAVVAGFILLGDSPFRWTKYWCALGCGILATFSFANGLLFWPLGFLALILIPLENGRQRKQALALWTAATVGVAVSYLCHFRYESPSGTPWTQFLEHPGEYLKYLFIYLGRPVINYQEYALAIGMIGLFLFGFLSLYLFLKKRDALPAYLPFFLFGLYSIGCGLLTGIGRVGFGSHQAMDGRYVPFSALIWVVNFVFLFILSQEIRGRMRIRLKRVLCLTGLGFLAFFIAFWIGRTSYRVGHRVFKSYHSRMLPAKHELLRGEDDELLLRLYNDAAYVRRGIEILKKHKLSAFR
jgi:hypothetical protein